MSLSIVDIEYMRIKDLVLSTQHDFLLVEKVNSFTNKHFLLSATSYLEYSFYLLMENATKKVISSSPLVNDFLFSNAVKKNFYKYFDFPTKDVRSFFKKFNKQDWKEHLYNVIVDEESFKIFKASFCELFEARNRLVHENYANFSLELTVDEIYHHFLKAHCFIFAVEKFVNSLSKDRTRSSPKNLEA